MGGALVLLPWAFWKTPLWKVLKSSSPENRSYLKIAVLAGILFGLDLAAWHRSVHGLGAGLSTVLGNTQVFHVAWIGIFFFGEKLKKSFFLYLLLGFVGLYFLLGTRPVSMDANLYQESVFFGLLTGVLYALYMTFLRQVERRSLALPVKLPTYANLGLVLFFSACTLALISTILGEWTIPTASDAAAIVGLVLVAQVLGWVLITRSLSQIPVSLAGLIILLQPLVSSVLGVVLFGEFFSTWQIVGGVLLLFSVYRGSLLRARSLK